MEEVEEEAYFSPREPSPEQRSSEELRRHRYVATIALSPLLLTNLVQGTAGAEIRFFHSLLPLQFHLVFVRPT